MIKHRYLPFTKNIDANEKIIDFFKQIGNPIETMEKDLTTFIDDMIKSPNTTSDISNFQKKSKQYANKIDVFGFGMLMVLCACTMSNNSLQRHITENTKFGKRCAKLINMATQADPRKRISAKKLVDQLQIANNMFLNTI